MDNKEPRRNQGSRFPAWLEQSIHRWSIIDDQIERLIQLRNRSTLPRSPPVSDYPGRVCLETDHDSFHPFCNVSFLFFPLPLSSLLRIRGTNDRISLHVRTVRRHGSLAVWFFALLSRRRILARRNMPGEGYLSVRSNFFRDEFANYLNLENL